MKIQPTAQKPQSIKNATNLFFISLVICLVLGIYNYILPETTRYTTGVITIFIALTFSIFLILKIYSGRNWTRILLKVLIIFSMPFFVLTIPSLYSISHVVGLVFILQMSIQVVATLELSSKTANEWFDSIKFANKNNVDLNASYNYKESDSILSSQEIDDFTKITELYKQGLLTDEEYKKQKQKYGIETQQNYEVLQHKKDRIKPKNIFVGIGAACLMYIYVLISSTDIDTISQNNSEKSVDALVSLFLKNIFSKNKDLCMDTQTIVIVKQSIMNAIEKDDIVKNQLSEFIKHEFVREEAYSKETNKYLCKANIIVGDNSYPVTFETYLTENTHYAQITEGLDILSLSQIKLTLVALYKTNFMNKKNAQKKTEITDDEFYAMSPEYLFESNPKGANILMATGQYKMIECPDEECYANFLVDGRRKYIEVVQEEHYDLAEANLNAYFKITAEKSYQEGYYVLKKLEKITR